MSHEWRLRTEDINPDKVLDYFVDLDHSRNVIDALKGSSPIILRGSRGVGKSFAMRVAEQELGESFKEQRVLPVYVKFERTQLIALGNKPDDTFLPWMISKVCGRILRVIQQKGISMPAGTALSTYSGREDVCTEMESIVQACESSWRSSDETFVASINAPGPDEVKDAVEDLCATQEIERIVLLIDEAAHVFVPQQQRHFFTLMRDLRSPFISVKAAVYPGATSYGDSFQPIHDATEITLDRSITDPGYARSMRDLVVKQNTRLKEPIDSQGSLFDTLAYAATGNPRILLKTISIDAKFSRSNLDKTVKSHYREEIWAEHSELGTRYPGHKKLIDWGRDFIEKSVLPALRAKNAGNPQLSSSYLWIHRDSPDAVKSALRLLCYSGVLQEGQAGVRGTRSEPGTRYTVNFGCQIALDANPLTYGERIRTNLSSKRMVEYGANHEEYSAIRNFSPEIDPEAENTALKKRLESNVSALELTDFQIRSLRSIGKNTVGEVIDTEESELRAAPYVGKVRSRQMKNAAQAAVFEYLSG